MEFLVAGGSPDDFGTDRNWKVVRKGGGFVKFVPDSEFDVIHSEYHCTARIDEFGGRRVVPSIDSASLLPCLGDSFTFGVGVNDGETFVDHLQRTCDRKLLNLGMPGSASPEQRFIVESRHEELQRPTKYFSFFFLGNDFADILARGTTCAASELSHEEPRESTTSVKTQGDSLYRRLSTKVNAFVGMTCLRRSYAIQFVKRTFMQVTADRRQNPVFLMMNRKNEEYHRRVRDALVAEFQAWRVLASEREFELTVVMIPDCYQVLPDRRKRQSEYYGIKPHDLDPLLPNRILESVLSENGILCIDPTNRILDLADLESLYYVNDNHLTARGHSRFADVIRDEVSEIVAIPTR
jgi:hypothetical protein